MKNGVIGLILGLAVNVFAGEVTESPQTIEKGHWELETVVLDYAQDGDFEAWTWSEINLTYGLSESVDLQFVFAPYVEEISDGESTEGTSDLTIRVKWNLWGNDEGKSAFALFPYLKAPIESDLSNDQWEGGLVLPYSFEINERVWFACQLEIARFYDSEQDDYDTDLLHSAVLGYFLTDKWGIYGEYLGALGHQYSAHASGGLTYAVNDLLQLDIGAIVGLNDPAVDFNVFTGFTYTF